MRNNKENFSTSYKLPPNWILNKEYRSKSDSSMVRSILTLINNSTEIIVVSSFFLAHDDIEQALVKAAKRSVRCYIMFAAEIRLRQESTIDEFLKKAYQRHVKTLKNLAGFVLIRASINFHAKIILCDIHNAPQGMLLTANLTEDALDRNQELAIHLTRNEVMESMKIIRWAFWEYSEHELIDYSGNFLPCRPLKEINEYKGTHNILQTTPNYKTIKDELINNISSNTKSIIISSFSWDAENPIIQKLCDLSRQGVSVTVLTRTRPQSQYTKLFIKMKSAGIRIFGFKWLHAKALITDSQTIVMSANIEKYGLDQGFELGIKLDDKRSDKIREVLKSWMINFQYEFVLQNDKTIHSTQQMSLKKSSNKT